jgi:hypothetical protein
VYLPSPQIARARGFRKVLGGMPVILTAAISVLGGATLAVGILCLSQSVENLETMRTYVAWPCLTVGTLILLGTAIRSINLDFGPLWDPIPSPNAHSWDTE